MWRHNYEPIAGSLMLSALIAAIPIVVLFLMLGLWRQATWKAALAALGSALVVALFVYGMPAHLAFASAGYGAAFGLLPIGWLILNAIFIYQLSVETGQFAVLQKQIAGVSGDRQVPKTPGRHDFGRVKDACSGVDDGRVSSHQLINPDIVRVLGALQPEEA